MVTKEDMQVITFNLDQEEYAMDVLQVYEIKRLKELSITRVPQAPDYVEGIIKFREEVIPLLDLRTRFGLSRREIDRETRIIVVRSREKYIGFIVDGVNEVLSFSPDEISDAPVETMQVNASFIQGIAHYQQERLIIILNVGKILSRQEETMVENLAKENVEEA